MLQELFRIPGLDLPIFGYGVMLVVGFFLALQLARFLARRCGLDPEAFVNAGLIALVSGVIGARASHVIENFSDYTRADLTFWQNLFNAINIREGGLTYYGGFLLALPLTILYGLYKRIPLRLGMDIVAPCLMIGLGFGRVGCFLNGCCHGATCDLPWAITFPYHSNAYLDHATGPDAPLAVPPVLLKPDPRAGLPHPIRAYDLLSPEELAKLPPQVREVARSQRSLPVHPAQLYSTFTAWLLAALLIAYFTLPHVPGRVFALMLILEGGSRFILEQLRAEPREYYGLSISMILGLGLLGAGVLLWLAFGLVHRRLDLPARAAHAS